MSSESDLIRKFGEKGADLVQRVRDLSKTSSAEGWYLTKEASIALDPCDKERLTKLAKAAHKQPLHEIAQGYLIDPTEELLHELKLQVIAVNINIFDLYRRVNKFDEAAKLGKQTLEDAIKTEDIHTILRAGNFFTLVQSAEAYKLIENNDYQSGLSKFREIERTFSSLPLNKAEGKNAVMLYSNDAANYLNIVHTSVALNINLSELQIELNSVAELANRAIIFLDRLSPQDKANWKANISYCEGYVAKYRKQFDIAIKDFESALHVSLGGANYPEQVAVLQTILAHTLIFKPEPDMEKALQYFKPVEEFLQTHDFGVDNYHYRPLVKQIREKMG